MNVKKMFAASTGVLMLATLITPAVNGAANYGAELTGAYEYAFSKGITTMSSIDNANMYGEITRGQLAKMISNWAEKELGTKVDATKVCSFTDANTAEGDLAAYLTKSCQMGLMGQGIDAFRPNSKVTRAEFGTTLSRALWGNKYEGATPYYANHLQALKDAGIMKKIETPSQLEIRGYVMLMLQRSATESLINKVTTGDNNTGVVKAGDLKVTAEPSKDRKVLLGAVSDMDTVTLKASQDINLQRVTLERYGYSNYQNVKSVWLEDLNGVAITNPASVTSKDVVNLSVKRDYRPIGKSMSFVIVAEMEDSIGNSESLFDLRVKAAELLKVYVEKKAASDAVPGDTTKQTAAEDAKKAWTDAEAAVLAAEKDTTNVKVGSTIGFKVTGVESSAKNLDISEYKPYEYNVVKYQGAEAEVSVRGTNKTHHYNEKDTFEVSRFVVKAGSAAIDLKGFVFDLNRGNNALDLDRYLDKVEVTVDGQAAKNVSFKTDRDSLTVNFDAQKININKRALVTVSVKLKALDRLPATLQLTMKKTGILATESKTNVRVSLKEELKATDAKIYTFKGGEVRLTNKKLPSTIDASNGATDVVIGEGSVELGEPVRLDEFTLTANKSGIKSMTFVVGNDSYDARKVGNEFKFSGVTLEKSSNIKILAEIDEEANTSNAANYEISFAKSFAKGAIKANVADGDVIGRYENSNENFLAKEFVGAINLSTVRVQPARGSLENMQKKTEVEVVKAKNEKVTLFEGEFTARKQEITLNEAVIESKGPALAGDDTVSFQLFINDKAVENFDFQKNDSKKAESFNDVLIKKGETVKVRVEANVYINKKDTYRYDLTLGGVDKDGKNITPVTTSLTNLKVDDHSSVKLTSNASDKTLVLKQRDIVLADFTLAPDKRADATLESFTIELTSDDAKNLTPADLRVKVGSYTVDTSDITKGTDGKTLTVSNLTEELAKEGTHVVVSAKNELAAGDYSLSLRTVNGNSVTRDFSKKVVSALVSVKSQENLRGSTRFTLSVEKADGVTDAISNFGFYSDTDATQLIKDTDLASVNDGSIIVAPNGNTVQVVKAIKYKVGAAAPVIIKNTDYIDFFLMSLNGKDKNDVLKVFELTN